MKRIPGKGSCFCVFLVVNPILCVAWLKLYVFHPFSALFHWDLWVFPRNRLADQSLPPGGTSMIGVVLALASTAWRWWISARRCDVVREFPLICYVRMGHWSFWLWSCVDAMCYSTKLWELGSVGALEIFFRISMVRVGVFEGVESKLNCYGS